MNGYGERCGNANLVSILPALQLKMGYDCVAAGSPAAADRDLPLRRRALQPGARPRSALRRPQRLRPQGRHARRGGEGRRAHLRAHRPGAGRQQPRRPDLRAVGQGLGASAAPRAPASTSTPTPRSAPSSGSRSASTAATSTRRPTPRSSCCCAARPAHYEPLFRLEGFRVITEKRADGKVETEATIKIWVDGQRYVRTAEGNGPVNALDRALRDAITELHPHLADIELVNYKVRILDAHHGTGAVTRVLLDSSDGQESWGSIGVSENIIEASWEALVDSLEYAFQPRKQRQSGSRRPSPLPSGRQRLRERRRADPARAARARRARGGAGARGAALRAALAGADAGALRARVRRLARGRRRGRGLLRHRRAPPRRPGARLGRRATR